MNRRKLFLSAALVGTAVSGFSQEVKQRVSSQNFVYSSEGPGNTVSFSGTPGMFAFVTSSGAEAGKTVTGAPYSAESVSETTRILSDGTRIVNRNTASMARDKDGRTRRESSVAHIGPWANSRSEAPRFATVIDPVSKEITTMNIGERTANKSKFGEPQIFRSESDNGGRHETMEARVHVSGSAVGGTVKGAMAGPPVRDMMIAAPALPIAGAMTMHRFDSKNAVKESLGKKNIEGVMAEGTRVTNTIPAGEIGNDRAIVSTEETWYSPELQMVVYSKNVDPQFGETEYRLINIKRSEPDANLFKIPSDFKLMEKPDLREMKQMQEKIMLRKKPDTI